MAEVLSPSARMHGNPPSSVVVGSNWTSRRMLMAMPRNSRRLLIFLLPYSMLVFGIRMRQARPRVFQPPIP
jgi:hypothetical protein